MIDFINPLYSILQNRRQKGYKAYGFTVPNWTKKDVEKLGNVAKKFGFPPQWLANLINFESGGTFNPSIKNPSSGATGLIQFMPQYFNVSKLSKMTVSQQIDEVDKYISNFFKRSSASKIYDSKRKKVKTNFTETDLFMIIFYPVAVGNPNYKFPSNVVKANAGITTPLAYTKKALSSSLIPFPNYPQKIQIIKPIEEEIKEDKIPLVYRIMIFAGISLIAYQIYKKMKGDLKSPIDLTKINF